MASIGIDASITELEATLVEAIPELAAERCVYADLDKLVAQIEPFVDDPDKRYACLLQYMDGNHGLREPFSKEVWYYLFSGILMIRANSLDDIEDEMRAVMDSVRTVGRRYPRGKNNLFSLLRISNVSKPIPTTIKDSPYYFLPFMITIFDKD